jgi:hypothetical protein
VEDRYVRAAGGEVLGHGLLADRAGAPGALVLGLVLEAQEKAADVRMGLAGRRLATSSAAFVLAARTGARATRVEIFRLPRHVLPSATDDGS